MKFGRLVISILAFLFGLSSQMQPEFTDYFIIDLDIKQNSPEEESRIEKLNFLISIFAKKDHPKESGKKHIIGGSGEIFIDSQKNTAYKTIDITKNDSGKETALEEYFVVYLQNYEPKDVEFLIYYRIYDWSHNQHIYKTFEMEKLCSVVVAPENFDSPFSLNDQSVNESFKNLAPHPKINLLLGLAKQVQYMHDNNFSHNDIKPLNIMFSRKDATEAKIIDFGSARYMLEKRPIFGSPFGDNGNQVFIKEVEENDLSDKQEEIEPEENQAVFPTVSGVTPAYLDKFMYKQSFKYGSYQNDIWALGICFVEILSQELVAFKYHDTFNPKVQEFNQQIYELKRVDLNSRDDEWTKNSELLDQQKKKLVDSQFAGLLKDLTTSFQESVKIWEEPLKKGLGEIIFKMLEIERKDRIQSIDAVVGGLKKLLESSKSKVEENQMVMESEERKIII